MAQRNSFTLLFYGCIYHYYFFKVTETNLPSEANIALPQVHVSAEYVQDSNTSVEGQFGGKLQVVVVNVVNIF